MTLTVFFGLTVFTFLVRTFITINLCAIDKMRAELIDRFVVNRVSPIDSSDSIAYCLQ
jgi:hypothetical protein